MSKLTLFARNRHSFDLLAFDLLVTTEAGGIPDVYHDPSGEIRQYKEHFYGRLLRFIVRFRNFSVALEL